MRSTITTPAKLSRLLPLFILSLLGSALLTTVPAQAATPPDSCFAFSGGIITDYYDNESNNIANPACTRDVDIPATIGGNAVTSIGDFAFYNDNLTSVTIPSSVTSIGGDAFSFNSLTSVIIPSSVTSIGINAFSATDLTSVTIPSSVNNIGIGAFQYNNLTSVTIPSSVTSIGSYTFANNDLTSVTIPSSVTSIGNYAFAYNDFTSVTIPNSVSTLGDYAFRDNNFTAPFDQSFSWAGLGGLSESSVATLLSNTVTISNATASLSDYTLRGVTLRMDFIINSGGVLKGTGSAGIISVYTGGRIAPGNSPGCLTTSAITIAGTYDAELGGTTACSGYDQLDVTGGVNLAGATLNLSLYGGYLPQTGNQYIIIKNGGIDAITGTFNGLAEGATVTVGNARFSISYVGGDGNDVVLTALNTPTAPNTGFTLIQNNPLVSITASIAAALSIGYLVRRRAARA